MLTLLLILFVILALVLIGWLLAHSARIRALEVRAEAEVQRVEREVLSKVPASAGLTG